MRKVLKNDLSVSVSLDVYGIPCLNGLPHDFIDINIDEKSGFKKDEKYEKYEICLHCRKRNIVLKQS